MTKSNGCSRGFVQLPELLKRKSMGGGLQRHGGAYKTQMYRDYENCKLRESKIEVQALKLAI